MPDQEFFMLVRKGLVQRREVKILGREMLMWPVAETHADMKRLAEHWGCTDARPARIGSLQGETLEGHIALALEDGCEAICCVNGWNADGSPRWKANIIDEEGGND